MEGLEEEESEALLNHLFEHQTQEGFVYRHKWEEGDMVLWDNRCLLHLGK